MKRFTSEVSGRGLAPGAVALKTVALFPSDSLTGFDEDVKEFKKHLSKDIRSPLSLANTYWRILK